MKCLAAASTLLLALPAAALAQGSVVTAHCASEAYRPPAELFERPIPLLPDSGTLRQKVSTASEEAQAYYDQGFSLLSSYVFIDAARSFHEALRRDPELAMAHLGLAKVYYVGLDQRPPAMEHLLKAAALAATRKVTDKEARWIALARQQFDAMLLPKEKKAAANDAYRQAVDELIKLDPQDPHAWVLRGHAQEADVVWGRGQGGSVGSIAYYETALRLDPDHLGAHHFLVHAYENIGRHAIAAEHGAAYARGAVGVPHAHHMYAHVLPRTGNWQQALELMSEADRVHRAAVAARGVPLAEDWHFAHNAHLLGSVHLRLGHDAEAARLYEEDFSLPKRPNVAPWINYLLMRGRFDEALAAARKAETLATPDLRHAGAALAGQALLALGREREAREARGRARKAYDEWIKKARNRPGEHLIPRYFGHHMKALEAELALRSGKGQQGQRLLLEIADQFAARPGIDSWATGLFYVERLALDARRYGQAALADALFERVRRIDPEYGGSARAAAGP